MFTLMRNMMASVTKSRTKVIKKVPEKPEVQAPKEPRATLKKSKAPRFCGVKHSYHHPFQKAMIPAGGEGVLLDPDSWLDSQIKAGLIKKL